MVTNRPAVVGAFVLGGLVLGVVAIVLFGGMHIFERTVRAVAFFEGSVAGLEIGAPVTFRGARVGSVQNIVITISRTGRARMGVFLELLPGKVVLEEEGPTQKKEESLAPFVEAGLRAQLQLQSFVTGQLRVDLDFRPETHGQIVAAYTGDVPQIPTLPSDLERLRKNLTELPLPELVNATQRAMAAIERVASHLDEEMTPLSGEAKRTLDSITRAMNATEHAVAHLEIDASHTLVGVDDLTDDARRQLRERGAELGRFLSSADRAAREAEALLISINGLVEPRARFRDDLEAAARDLASTASSLRDFARNLQHNPAVLLRGSSER